MARSPKKKRLGRRILFSILGFFFLVTLGLYFLVSSPKFIHWVIGKINQAIPGEFTYDNLHINLERGVLTGQNLRYLNELGQTAFGADSIDLRFKLIAALRGRLEVSSLNAEGVVVNFGVFPEKKSPGPTQWRSLLKLLSNRLAVKQSLLSPVDLIFKDGSQVHLENLEIKITKQVLQEQKIQLKFSESEINFKNKTISTGPLTFHGSMDIPVWTEFNFFVKEASGDLEITDLKLPNIDLAQLSTDFSIKKNTIRLKDGKFKNPHGTLDLDLTYNSEKPAVKVEVKTDQPIPFEAIPRASDNLKQTFTAFTMDLKADLTGGKLEQLDGPVDLKITALGNRSQDNTPDHTLTLKGKFDNGTLFFKLLEIVSEKMTFKGTGNVNFAKQKFDVKFTTDNFDITTLVNTLADIDLTGNADAEGTITGTFKNPNFYVEAKAEEAGYSFMNFGKVDGIFKIENGTLSFVGGSPKGEDYSTQVDVKTSFLFDKNKRSTHLDSKFQNLEAGKLLLNEDYQGKVTGSFVLEALPGSVEKGTLEAKIENFVIYDFHFDEIEASGKLGKNQFTIEPVTFIPPDQEKITVPTPVVFSFDDRGWDVKGTLLPGLTIEGKFSKAQPSKVSLDWKFKNLDLRPVLAAMLFPVKESQADGEIKMLIGLDDAPTNIDLSFTKLNMPLEEGFIRNDGTIQVEIRPPKVNFKNVKFFSGGETFSISGIYTLDGPINLDLKGNLNLGVLEFLPNYFRDGEGFADMDLKVRGTYEAPSFLGQLNFNNASLTLRPVRGQIEGLNGTLRLTPDAAVFDKLRGTMREGDLIINGRVGLKNLKPTGYDLEIQTREVALSEPGNWKIIFSGDFQLKGPAGKAVLSGIMDINDGVYSRDFDILSTVLKPQVETLKEEQPKFYKDINLDLQIRSPGELAIKNNIAKINFNADLKVSGPMDNPKIGGALEVLGGTFHYFTVDFTGARGTIDFRDPKRGPYVNIILSKTYQTSFETTTVEVIIQGFVDDMQIAFNSNPPLGRQDIMALVFTGALPGDVQRKLSGGQLATTVLASQLSQLISRPLADKAKIDIFRLEATDPSSRSLSALVIGKKLTDRLSLEFKTDLGVDKPLQGVQMEYLLIDNVLIKGTQFTNGEFDFFLALRFLLF